MLASCLDWVQRLTLFRFRHGRETTVPQTAKERQRRLEKHQQDGKAGKPRGGHTSFNTDISWIAENSTTLVLVEAKLDTAGTAGQQAQAYAHRIIEELGNSAAWRSVEQVDVYTLLLKGNGDFISCTLVVRCAVPRGGGGGDLGGGNGDENGGGGDGGGGGDNGGGDSGGDGGGLRVDP